MKRFLIIALVAFLAGCGASCPQQVEPIALMGAIDSNDKGMVHVLADETGVADGSFEVYIDLRKFKRGDFLVEQSGGSGTISFIVEVSYDPGGNTPTAAQALTYTDVGLAYYSNATFTDLTEILNDNGWKLYAVTWMRLTFTVSGAAADASYKVTASRIHPDV
jgi:hypothetical protein